MEMDCLLRNKNIHILTHLDMNLVAIHTCSQFANKQSVAKAQLNEH